MPDLKALLKRAGLPREGSKTALGNRLVEHVAHALVRQANARAQAAAHEAGGSADAPPAPAPAAAAAMAEGAPFEAAPFAAALFGDTGGGGGVGGSGEGSAAEFRRQNLAILQAKRAEEQADKAGDYERQRLANIARSDLACDGCARLAASSCGHG